MLCSQCGVGQILEDDYGAEVTMVCNNCGCLQEERVCTSLQSSPNENFHLVSLDKKYHQNFDRKASVGFKFINEMNSCIDLFSNQNDAIKLAAEEMYTKMCYEDKSFFRPKIRLAAACVYLSLKEANFPTSIHAITAAMGIKTSKLHKVISKVKHHLDIIGGPSLEDEIRAGIEGLISMKGRPDLVQKAMDVYLLLNDLSITVGRSPATVCVVCSYWATIAEEKKQKHFTTLKSFCRTNNTSLTSVHSLFKVSKQRLSVLMKRLPWIYPEMSPEQFFHVYIDDVLHYKRTLFANCISEESDVNNEVLTVPPSLSKNIKVNESRWFPEASTSEVLCEDDLPDSELGLYLRSKEEISQVVGIRERLKDLTE